MALASEESRVLLLYTGGTIGMLVSDAGYVPEPFFLFETLRSQTSRFHDPLGDSLLSRGRSVEGFRAWSEGRSREQSKSRAVSREKRDILEKRGASNKATLILTALHKCTPPAGDINEDGERTPADERTNPFNDSQKSSPQLVPSGLNTPSTLLVRSKRPLQAPPLMEDSEEITAPFRGRIDGGVLPQCKKVGENCYEMHLPSLVTPIASSAPSGNVKRIRYAVLEVIFWSFAGLAWSDCLLVEPPARQ
jgi:lysophospholipase